MLDLKTVRRDPQSTRVALARRGDNSEAVLDRVLELDIKRRELLPEIESLRARQNEASQAIGRAKQQGEDGRSEIEAMQSVATKVRALQDELSVVQAELDESLAQLPNPPVSTAADVDTTIREVGSTTKTGKDHLELVGDLVDMEAGARVAGSRFAYLKGDLVLVEFALVRWVLEILCAKGFEPVIPPVLVREEALFGTGFLPDTEQQIYRLADDDLYLAGTSEVALASLHSGEILQEERLPLRYAGFSTCFRREAGAAGRDARGIFRVHQFDKVEMFSFVTPEEALIEHEFLLGIEEEIFNGLGIPYRVLNVGVRDLGASAAKKYDCEAWLPGQGNYRELTSTSNTTDFQSRRLNIRYRPNDGSGPTHVHTLNGTAIAVGRTLIAIVENGQQADGSIVIPEVLTDWGAPAQLKANKS